LSHLRTLESLGDVGGTRVLVRCDFNVPLADGRVADDTRIRSAVPTLTELLDAGAAVVACSHLGRPKGTADPRLRLDPVAERLGEELGRPVRKLDEVTGPGVRASVEAAGPGSVVVLENLRFDPREERNDPGFAAELAELAAAYVDDAFGAAHRAHASVDAVTRLLPAAAGRLMQREVEVLTRLRDDPARPFAAILGGAKVSDKLGVVNALIDRVDSLLIGGAMAFSFLAACGTPVGRSLVEPERYEECRSAVEAARTRGVSLLLPQDVVVAAEASEEADRKTVDAGSIPADGVGLDVGPRTVEAFRRCLQGARTVFWNGPMGVFELAAFADGTKGVAAAVADSGAFTVVGGGDSVAAIRQMGLSGSIDHLSTGGGASLEFIEGRSLPGIAALMEED